FDSGQHPGGGAGGDVADLPSVHRATTGADPDYDVTTLLDHAVRAALAAVGYAMDAPRTFEIGDDEPEDVAEVCDPAGRHWTRGENRLWFMPGVPSPALPWVELLARIGELAEVPAAPAGPTRAEVIERAAEVFCDSSTDGVPWADLAEPVRALYRRRQSVVADAGLLADPAVFAEIGRLRAERARLTAQLDDARQAVRVAERAAEDAQAEAERLRDPRSWSAVWRPYGGPAEQWTHGQLGCVAGDDGVMELRLLPARRASAADRG
ncbi:hypothetical protein, partial [Amycolatopsis solani]|uniref:hypothetical protein n=1 Tax=Amycolatopsis solani TaxID=3028615 RepID=UPI0025B0B930